MAVSVLSKWEIRLQASDPGRRVLQMVDTKSTMIILHTKNFENSYHVDGFQQATTFLHTTLISLFLAHRTESKKISYRILSFLSTR